MSRHDSLTSLRQMRDHALEAIDLASGRDVSDLETDRLLGLALSRLLEIIGKAAARVPNEVRQRFPQIPWSSIVGVRNRMIHAYDAVDYPLVWETVQRDLPELVRLLDDALGARR